MSAEPIRVSTHENWSVWEGQVANGLYPLRRFLGGTEHSGVFLTEYRAPNLVEAAIKFVPTDRQRAVTQLSQWRAAKKLSHPHLLRLFDLGGFQFEGRAFLFVVMEHAEQTLAQLLPKRALAAEEAQELLPPTLDALTFLHRHGLVHGQVKPSNVLVVNDQVRLASDTIRWAGHASSGLLGTSLYDAPESNDGAISPAGDIWSLGVTLVEALTQHTPSWEDGGRETLANLPEAFLETVQRCLTREPADRPSAFELQALYRPVSQTPPTQDAPVAQSRDVAAQPSVELPPEQPVAQVPAEQPPATPAPQSMSAQELPVQQVLSVAPAPGVSVQEWSAAAPAQPVTSEPPAPAAPAPQAREISPSPKAEATVLPAPTPAARSESPAPPSSRGILLSLPVIFGALLIFLIGWVVLRSPQKPAPPAAPPPAVASVAPAPSANSPPALAATSTTASTTTAPATADPSSAVLREVMPDVPRRSLNTVRGHIKVTVRVLVDPAGNVVGDLLEKSGPSSYFARRAREAATEWKFAPIPDDGRDSRVWLVHFDFSRSGVTARTTAVR